METKSPDQARHAEASPALAMPRRIDAVDVGSRESCERLFVSCLPLIRRVIAALGRRHQLSADDAEELGAIVQLRIIKDDYAVLRKFQGRCSLRTFLTVVIERVFLDYRTSQWGRWRPSARSRQIGEVAVLFEQLTVRDGLTFDQACLMLEINHRVPVDSKLLARYAAELPRRTRPRFVAEDILEEIEAACDAPDERLVGAEQMGIVTRAANALTAALERFAPQDRLILKLRFADGLSTAEIARMLHLESHPLYARVNRLLRTLRTLLEARGMRRDDVLAALGSGDAERADVFGGQEGWRLTAGASSPCISNVA